MAASLAGGGTLGAEATKQLKGFKERIINLLTERDEINDQIKEIFNEVGEAGFDKKVTRKAIGKLRQDPAKVRSEEEMVDAYIEAMGGLPLFEAANAKAA